MFMIHVEDIYHNSICPEPKDRLRPKTFQAAKEILNQGCQIMFKAMEASS